MRRLQSADLPALASGSWRSPQFILLLLLFCQLFLLFYSSSSFALSFDSTLSFLLGYTSPKCLSALKHTNVSHVSLFFFIFIILMCRFLTARPISHSLTNSNSQIHQTCLNMNFCRNKSLVSLRIILLIMLLSPGQVRCPPKEQILHSTFLMDLQYQG